MCEEDCKNAFVAGWRAAELAQRLRALAPLPGFLSSVPINHMVAHIILFWPVHANRASYA